jgi:hypothetical protein
MVVNIDRDAKRADARIVSESDVRKLAYLIFRWLVSAQHTAFSNSPRSLLFDDDGYLPSWRSKVSISD